MQHVNGSDQEGLSLPLAKDIRPMRQLVKARDVAKKLGVSISWVIQHASGKRQPYLPAVKTRVHAVEYGCPSECISLPACGWAVVLAWPEVGFTSHEGTVPSYDGPAKMLAGCT